MEYTYLPATSAYGVVTTTAQSRMVVPSAIATGICPTKSGSTTPTTRGGSRMAPGSPPSNYRRCQWQRLRGFQAYCLWVGPARGLRRDHECYTHPNNLPAEV